MESYFTAREARVAIARERQTRYWTNTQRADALGKNWPSESARITREADAAVDWLADALDQLRSVWDAHFTDCPHPIPGLVLPTLDDLARWRDAPSDTASA